MSDDIGIVHRIYAAEAQVVKAAMAYYQHCQEHTSCRVPPGIEVACEALAPIYQEWVEYRAAVDAAAALAAPAPRGEGEGQGYR